jgi:hypothetical protein
VGTRNNFAMDIGLDRDDPLAALQAVMEPRSLAIDYERIDNRCSSSREAPRSFDRSSRRARDPSYNQMLWMTGFEKEGGVPFQT